MDSFGWASFRPNQQMPKWSSEPLTTVAGLPAALATVFILDGATVAEDVEWRRLGLAAFRPLGKRLFTSAQISDRNAASFASAPRERAAARLPNSYQRASDWLLQGYAAGMSDDPPRPKPEPPPKSGSVVSIADRNQELRHEAARRLAERHNASLRPLPDATA